MIQRASNNANTRKTYLNRLARGAENLFATERYFLLFYLLSRDGSLLTQDYQMRLLPSVHLRLIDFLQVYQDCFDRFFMVNIAINA